MDAIMQQSTAFDGGFADPVRGSQSVFRAVMEAMARPCTIQPVPRLVLPPLPLTAAAGGVIAALADAETPVWLDPSMAKTGEVGQWIAFHTGAPIVTQQHEAVFAVVASPQNLTALNGFAMGSQEYPDRSTTVILQVNSLSQGAPLAFEGPGIDGRASIAPQPMPHHFAAQWKANRAAFPRGVDLILAGADCVAALPRSARLVSVEA